MNYPRLLNLDKEVRQNLAQWFDRELQDHIAERGEWVSRITRWREDYNAYPSTTQNDYPFRGASNIIIPLSAIAVEATHARMMQTLYALDQKIAVKIHDPAQASLELELEKYLDRELFGLKSFDTDTEHAVLELIKYGTGAAETGYEKVVRKGIKTSEDKEEEFEVVVSEGNYVCSVPITDIVKPFSDTDFQNARWAGRIVRVNPHQLQQMENQGLLEEGTYERLDRFFNADYYASENSYRNRVDETLKQKPVLPQEVMLYHIYTAWDVDNAEYDKHICFYYSAELRDVVGVYYNQFADLRIPLRTGNYFPEEFRWTGIGICQQNEQFQQEVTTQHRQRLDNATIANMQMFIVKRDAVEIEPDEPIFPGKLWFVNERDDITALPLGDVKVSSYNNENQAVIYSQQRTGVNELTLGMPQVGTPGTATDSAARVQESARKADYSYNNIKKFLNQLLMDSVCNIQQFGPNINLLRLSPSATELELFLKNPYELFRKKILLEVTLVGQNQNRFMDRQQITQFSGVVQQYYQSLLEIAQMTQNQEMVAAISQKAIEGANEAMKHILASYEIREPSKYLFDASLQVGASGPSPMALQGGQPNAIPVPQQAGIPMDLGANY